MPPTLRKRAAPAAEPAAAPPAKKKAPAAKKPVAKKGEATTPKATKPAPASDNTAQSSITVGSTPDLDGFGGEVLTHDDKTVTLKSLLEESKQGVILFTYPKASTPGCES